MPRLLPAVVLCALMLVHGGRAAFTEFVRNEVATYAKLLDEAGIRAID